MAGNIAKLEVRHLNKTGGFNPDAATEEGRDREAEQAAAEGASEVERQKNYRGDELGEKQPAAEPTQHVHAADGDSAD